MSSSNPFAYKKIGQYTSFAGSGGYLSGVNMVSNKIIYAIDRISQEGSTANLVCIELNDNGVTVKKLVQYNDGILVNHLNLPSIGIVISDWAIYYHAKLWVFDKDSCNLLKDITLDTGDNSNPNLVDNVGYCHYDVVSKKIICGGTCSGDKIRIIDPSTWTTEKILYHSKTKGTYGELEVHPTSDPKKVIISTVRGNVINNPSNPLIVAEVDIDDLLSAQDKSNIDDLGSYKELFTSSKAPNSGCNEHLYAHDPKHFIHLDPTNVGLGNCSSGQKALVDHEGNVVCGDYIPNWMPYIQWKGDNTNYQLIILDENNNQLFTVPYPVQNNIKSTGEWGQINWMIHSWSDSNGNITLAWLTVNGVVPVPVIMNDTIYLIDMITGNKISGKVLIIPTRLLTDTIVYDINDYASEYDIQEDGLPTYKVNDNGLGGLQILPILYKPSG